MTNARKSNRLPALLGAVLAPVGVALSPSLATAQAPTLRAVEPNALRGVPMSRPARLQRVFNINAGE